jgi:hypothetical protein
MARSHSFTATTLKHLASRVSARLGPQSISLMNTRGRVELAESFEVWFMGRSAIVKRYDSIASLAHRTGYWHHQLRFGGDSLQYARSMPFGPGDKDWEVHAVLHSDLAAGVAKGIDLIDADPAMENAFVRMLTTPAYLTTSLWIQMNDKTERVLVVDSPAGYKNLVRGEIYLPTEYLSALASERHSEGLPRRSNHLPSIR